MKALSVKQPYASAIANGNKQYELRSRNTHYRGDCMICASKKPILMDEDGDELPIGAALAIVEIYDSIHCSDLTPEQWDKTCIPENERYRFNNCYAWCIRNVRRIIPYPITGQLGLFEIKNIDYVQIG